jgi:hypothetical protein
MWQRHTQTEVHGPIRRKLMARLGLLVSGNKSQVQPLGSPPGLPVTRDGKPRSQSRQHRRRWSRVAADIQDGAMELISVTGLEPVLRSHGDRWKPAYGSASVSEHPTCWNLLRGRPQLWPLSRTWNPHPFRSDAGYASAVRPKMRTALHASWSQAGRLESWQIAGNGAAECNDDIPVGGMQFACS